MGQVKLFADSTCDLGAELIERYEISIVPLYVVFEDRTYKDGVDIVPSELFRLVEAKGTLPKTAAPSPADFMEKFAPYIEQGRDILYISLSSELSSTNQNARIAAGQFPEGRISVIDSRNLTTGIGLLLLRAARLAEQGASLAAITEEVNALRGKVETQFVIDTLDYLHKGGRMSGLASFIGSLLKIRPIVKVTDGKLGLHAKVRGKREKAIDQMLSEMLADRDAIDPETAFVAHAADPETAVEIRELLLQKGFRHVLLAEAGCVISSHCGPRTVGVILMRR
ncbi:DegV family protein [Paenibacillus sp. J31TS4]|uniref:DegV family protein n=1 Tax=Paenibacillus sp. J31TS4 TaxID=2807195 RepID=UPI001B1EE57D|nr:DegV family protein [Paenibacillus sp. J31TS4]GIP37189.1 DegV family protein [Paenibacillus sp. J31TS4]